MAPPECATMTTRPQPSACKPRTAATSRALTLADWIGSEMMSGSSPNQRVRKLSADLSAAMFWIAPIGMDLNGA
jgi:hypothetical protein